MVKEILKDAGVIWQVKALRDFARNLTGRFLSGVETRDAARDAAHTSYKAKLRGTTAIKQTTGVG
jgi:hypothetical protein